VQYEADIAASYIVFAIFCSERVMLSVTAMASVKRDAKAPILVMKLIGGMGMVRTDLL
jgi:hypothetical protein